MKYRMDPKITGFDRIKYLLVALGGAAVGGVVMFGGGEDLRSVSIPLRVPLIRSGNP